METARLFSGLRVQTSFETQIGSTATVDRDDPESYTLNLQVKVRVPKAHRDLAEITRLNDQLPVLLPALPAMLETANVSPFFDELYRLKCANVERNLPRLNELLSRHNFYDCETILELQHPETQRRAIFIQADMDVDSDGSDSDRVPEIDGSSVTFQPFTSYKWPKKTAQPNSFIIPREARLKQLDAELAKNIMPARAKEIRTTQAQLRLEIADLQKASFLVAATDPFIVLPGSMLRGPKTPFSPKVGDYAVVIAGGTIYPAIFGDVGPTIKMGEASTRMCLQINPRSSAISRPVNDLKVTYIVFPGTAETPFDAPDLEKWHARCAALLAEIGGHQGQLFVWENLIKPPPPPAPPVQVPVDTAAAVPPVNGAAQTPAPPAAAPVAPAGAALPPAPGTVPSPPAQPPQP
jgi:hypothetical protein